MRPNNSGPNKSRDYMVPPSLRQDVSYLKELIDLGGYIWQYELVEISGWSSRFVELVVHEMAHAELIAIIPIEGHRLILSADKVDLDDVNRFAETRQEEFWNALQRCDSIEEALAQLRNQSEPGS